ncbi:hypothetical protein [Microcystis aeruginosa]|uniref:Uncharacterized protein n=1 Tax=Microcystis aeruginosa PCC 9443 TaxID=1160281 RepID=I4G3P5_MICAE|nr:hypothetical protein [Microcystis aeruginosa]CCI02556.1 hypothetical protein MICAC_3470012 [Microcystis aeruginosa PCC 9443]
MGIVETVIAGIIVSVISYVAGVARTNISSQLPSQISGSQRIYNQDKLYEELIERLEKQQKLPEEVIFIQHSGYMVVKAICRLLERGINVTLYQQNPETDIIAEYDSLKTRIRGVQESIIYMEGTRTFQAQLTIKLFRTPASLRAVLVKGKRPEGTVLETLIVSWYLYWVDSDNNQLRIRGSENPGIILNRDSSKKFEDFEKLVLETQRFLDSEHRGTHSKRLSDHVSICDN